MAATIFANAFLKKSGGGKFKLADFQPHHADNQTTPEDHLNPDSMFELLKGLANGD